MNDPQQYDSNQQLYFRSRLGDENARIPNYKAGYGNFNGNGNDIDIDNDDNNVNYIGNEDRNVNGNRNYGFENESVGHPLDSNYRGDTNEVGPDPGILLDMLETAVRYDEISARTAASTATTTATSSWFIPEDAQRNHREHLEKTWKAIRTHWLWAHETTEERSVGARAKGDHDLAPLHLICKLAANPPSDIWKEIVRAAPEVTEWEDDHGWLPLHHACLQGASTEVLKLLTEIHPRSLVALDIHHRTPLHLYATRETSDHSNPRTLATNFSILCGIVNVTEGDEDREGLMVPPVEVKDTAGMIPMHYACAYGTTPGVLRVLEHAFPECLEARDNHGRTPLHFAMVNAQRTASPGVLGFLLGHNDEDDGDDKENDDDDEIAGEIAFAATRGNRHRIASVNVRDQAGNLPLHLLNLGLVGVDFDRDPDKLKNVAECLKLYLEAQPYVSTDFLAALQALPDPLQDVAVVSPHVRNILNAKIIQRFPTSILMLDGIMLVTMIVCFELATARFVDLALADAPLENTHQSYPLIMLCVTSVYFFLRELIQVIASLTLGVFGSWFYDTTNWLDVLVIALVTYYTTIMTLGESQTSWVDTERGVVVDDGLGSFRTGTALTKGVLWTAVIFFLKSTQVDFAVFLNGVFYVVRRLVAFLLAILVILITFAQMFWVVYLEQPVCTFSCRKGDAECEIEMEGCNFPHCEFGDSFLKVYTMMMGEIGTETRYDENLVAQVLYIFYGFFIVILLSNVLIAIVTDSYEIVQNDRAAIVFWSNRLDFVAEMDSISSVVRKRIFCTESDETKEKNAAIAPNETQDDRSYESGTSSNSYSNRYHGTEEWFRDKWNFIMSIFEHDVYGATGEDTRPMDFWYDVLNKTLAILVIPPWLILGFVTVGTLWPPQVREWLFVQKDTTASRAEIERRKLEQLREIQSDTKLLKDELKIEMQHDREEMFRMKAEVDAVQEEVLADLQQVNALVTTLLTDLGGIPCEG